MTHFPFFQRFLSLAVLLTAAAGWCGAPAAEELFPTTAFAKRDLRPYLDYDLSKAERIDHGPRSCICLNQIWRFLPVEKSSRGIPPPTEPWGYFLVPSYWRSSARNNEMRNAEGFAVKSIHGKNVDQYEAAWYGRELNVPAEFSGRRLILYFEEIYTHVEVWINGEKIDLKDSGRTIPSLAVDVTGKLKCGQTNTLYVRTEIDGYRDRGGLRGNVYLYVRPMKNFGNPSVDTFFDKRCITVDFLDANLGGAAGTLAADIRDAKTGQIVFSQKLPYSGHIVLNTVTPKLWSPESPNLYFLDLKLTGGDGKVLDAASLRFGFRQLVIENGLFKLNGKPIRLICDSAWPRFWTPNWNFDKHYLSKAIRTMKAMDVNALYAPHEYIPSVFYRVADEEGILVLYHTALPYRWQIEHTNQQAFTRFSDLMREHLHNLKFQNHPSIAAILIDIWYNQHPGATNPYFVGVRSGDPNVVGDRAKRQARLEEMAKIGSRIMPDKLMMTGGSAKVGNLYSTHIYHTWAAPLAELSAMFKTYSETKRDLAIFIGETNLPFMAAFAPIYLYKGPATPYMYWMENSARLLGNKAYTLKEITAKYAYNGAYNDFLSGSSCFDKTTGRTSYFLADLYAYPLIEYLKHTFFPWRFDGVDGIGPFEYVLTSRMVLAGRSFPKIDFLKNGVSTSDPKGENMRITHQMPVFEITGKSLDLQPTIASIPYLHGVDKLTCDFLGAGKNRYEIDHAWFGGRTIAKKLAVINQTLIPRNFEMKVSLRNSAGGVVAEKTARVNVPGWSRSAFPFELKTPKTDVRKEMTLVAELVPVDNNPKALRCSMPVQIFPPVRKEINDRTLSVLSVDNILPEQLKKLGYHVRRVDNLKDLPRENVLVIGRTALRELKEFPDFGKMAEAGYRVLILEQEKTDSPELVEVRCRKAFRNAVGHPALRGFKDEDFANWRGSHSLVPAKGKGLRRQWTAWGNRNMVAGYTFRRPQHGNFLSLLVSGFDLYQTPLLEYRGRNGGWIASQLDISEQIGTDPVATLLLCRLIDYLDSGRPVRGETLFFGKDGGAGEKLMQKMGVNCRETDLSDKDLREARLLVISDPDWKTLRDRVFAISNFVYSGGKVLYCHTSETFSHAFLPFPVEVGSEEMNRATVSGEGTAVWRMGWDQNDLYWRNKRKLPVFRDFPKIAEHTTPAVLVRHPYGTGEYILTTLTPDRFEKSYASGKVCRLLSALFTSMGAKIETPDASPFLRSSNLVISLAEQRWEFAVDPENKGIEPGENYASGNRGSAHWQTGQTTGGGEFVRPGINYERFLGYDYNGWCWYRVEFDLEKGSVAPNRKMFIKIDDIRSRDETYINGKRVGKYGVSGRLRYYPFNSNLLKPGKNIVVFHIYDDSPKGGILGNAIISSQTEKGYKSHYWQSPWPEGAKRDYNYNPDVLRLY